ncbi:MAG: DbpA RNA binding domain-containing protein [Sphaerochaetaceae bacterium]|nr:DbpA RNA binding domain-containing protein [Sphaerochaetaceae bacterium]
MSEITAEEKAKAIKNLVAEMKLYNNPQELEDLKKLIRKNVPFSMRGYFSAYLYLKAEGSLNSRRPRPRSQARPVEHNAKNPDGTSLYINVGRQSRATAKDLAAFICKESGIESSQILSIVFKQNFSFIIVDNKVAENVVSAVNGKEFKGRKVKMSPSKEKSAE